MIKNKYNINQTVYVEDYCAKKAKIKSININNLELSMVNKND